MHSIGRILLPSFMILLLASCTEHEPVHTGAPEPVIETISFDESFAGMVLDREGTPHLLELTLIETGEGGMVHAMAVSRVHRLEGDSLVTVFPDLPVMYAIAIDNQDRFYGILSGMRTLVRISSEGVETVFENPENDSLPFGTGSITSLHADHHGNLWFPLYCQGVMKWNGSGGVMYTAENSGLLSNYTRTLCMDRSNTLWLGHNQGGISRILDNGTTDIVPGFTGQNIMALAADGSGNVLAGLAWYNNDTLLYRIGQAGSADISPRLNISYPDTILVVKEIAVDNSSRIWIELVSAVDLQVVKTELYYYYNGKWNRMPLETSEKSLFSLEADRRSGYVYVLDRNKFHRIR